MMSERIWGDLVVDEERGEDGRVVCQTVRMQAKPMEEVVRCRDCGHYDSREGFGCSVLGKWNEATRGFVACDMGAGGFCAWGVRRESE